VACCDIHYIMVTGIKEFECQVCQRKFNRRWGLLVHYKCHLQQHQINIQTLAEQLQITPQYIENAFNNTTNDDTYDMENENENGYDEEESQDRDDMDESA